MHYLRLFFNSNSSLLNSTEMLMLDIIKMSILYYLEDSLSMWGAMLVKNAQKKRENITNPAACLSNVLMTCEHNLPASLQYLCTL